MGEMGRVCLPKAKGGLGIKNLEAFNIALLRKWRWKCMTGSNNLWFKLLSSRYGDLCKWRESEAPNKVSKVLPCGDVTSNLLGSDFTQDYLWFNNIAKLKLGSGDKLRFWTDAWCGPSPFSSLLPILFQVCDEKTSTVKEFGQWSNNRWT